MNLNSSFRCERICLDKRVGQMAHHPLGSFRLYVRKRKIRLTIIMKGGTFLLNTCRFPPSEGSAFTVIHLDSPIFHLLFPRQGRTWVSLAERVGKAQPGPFANHFPLLAGMPTESICLALPLSCGKGTFPSKGELQASNFNWV